MIQSDAAIRRRYFSVKIVNFRKNNPDLTAMVVQTLVPVIIILETKRIEEVYRTGHLCYFHCMGIEEVFMTGRLRNFHCKRLEEV
jgi:hypothetical protein